ncbi:hypothetical protein EVAR_36317_1 [Eumeta japonica]|uniref:Uncharacterized protein n=1 Tax=Eumeta variegata TaxID=151549 RepID=A0A4C1VKW4_EUMVA|nr:hypothetical protein EVAR_36317_1 [Eumeta japonica]
MQGIASFCHRRSGDPELFHESTMAFTAYGKLLKMPAILKPLPFERFHMQPDRHTAEFSVTRSMQPPIIPKTHSFSCDVTLEATPAPAHNREGNPIFLSLRQLFKLGATETGVPFSLAAGQQYLNARAHAGSKSGRA